MYKEFKDVQIGELFSYHTWMYKHIFDGCLVYRKIDENCGKIYCRKWEPEPFAPTDIVFLFTFPE